MKKNNTKWEKNRITTTTTTTKKQQNENNKVKITKNETAKPIQKNGKYAMKFTFSVQVGVKVQTYTLQGQRKYHNQVKQSNNARGIAMTTWQKQ
jgi:hypothetical protein